MGRCSDHGLDLLRETRDSRRSPPMCHHAHPVARAQGEQRLKLDPKAGRQAEAPSARDGGEHQYAFHPAERLTNTLGRAAAEWKIRESGARITSIGRPAH